jgi:hypothetical protein
MLAAARTIFIEFHPIGIIAAILLGGVIALFAVIALKRNYGTNIFLLGCHFTTFLLSSY